VEATKQKEEERKIPKILEKRLLLKSTSPLSAAPKPIIDGEHRLSARTVSRRGEGGHIPADAVSSSDAGLNTTM
jgi:hypothetical protein